MGVPAYEMDSELRTLEDIGPTYKPDLVIVGFYENDLGAPAFTMMPQWQTNLKNFFRKYFYLFYYVKIIHHRLSSHYVHGHTAAEFFQKSYLSKPTIETPTTDVTKFVFKHGLKNSPRPPKTTRVFKPKNSPANIKKLIAKFQKYHSEGTYKIVFFINIAPDCCTGGSYFIDGVHNEMNDWFMDIMGKGTPVLSSYDAFWSYKPSEVPGASLHSLATANLVKADILFNFISKNISK